MEDSNIRLRDAAGREIPIGTNTVYTEDGKKLYTGKSHLTGSLINVSCILLKLTAGYSTNGSYTLSRSILKIPLRKKAGKSCLMT